VKRIDQEYYSFHQGTDLCFRLLFSECCKYYHGRLRPWDLVKGRAFPSDACVERESQK
jgi:hypothetical protein